MALAERHLVPAAKLLASTEQGIITVDEAYAAREVILLAGDTHIYPVTSLDGHTIGDGKPGPVCAALKKLLAEDAACGEEDHEEL